MPFTSTPRPVTPAPKISTPAPKVSSPAPKVSSPPKVSSKPKVSITKPSTPKPKYNLKKPEAKANTKANVESKAEKKVVSPPSHSTTQHHYHSNSSAMDWMPFMFMAGMLDHQQTVVVNGTPQTQTYNPNPVAEGISILITLIAFTVIGTILWKLFKPKKKKAWKK